MAKVILFSDLHAHAFKPYATLLPGGVNSRLRDAVSCIEQIHAYATQNQISAVLFGGDMFHVRKNIHVAAFNMVFEAMSRFAVSKIPVLMIPGNHDQADLVGDVYSVYSFSTFCDVVGKPDWHVVDAGAEALQVLAIPYIENAEHVRALTETTPPEPHLPKIQLSHLGVQGAVVGADFVYINKHDPTVEDLHPERFDAVYLGHYHLHQKLAPNAWYIGAPLEHNWGDRGGAEPRGFLVYDTETRTHTRVPLRAPRFVVTAVPSVDYEPLPELFDNYVRVVSDQKFSVDQLEEMRRHHGMRSLEVVPTTKGLIQCVHARRLEVDPRMSPEDLVRKYVESGLGDSDGLDESYLIQLGQEMLQEVEESK